MAMQDLELFLELPFYNFQMFYSAGKILRFYLTSRALIFHVLGATHSIRSLEQNKQLCSDCLGAFLHCKTLRRLQLLSYCESSPLLG
jgi:hypothetical protein